MHNIARIDISPLFGNSAKRDSVDAAIADAAFNIGFMTVHGVPQHLRVGASERAILLSLFDMPQDERRRLYKRNFAPENPHLYRGWFPLESSPMKNREGFEIGPDLLRPHAERDTADILCEPTPVPDPSHVAPQWRETAMAYYADMEDIGLRILDSLSRSLGINPHIFRDAFDRGISTLRLLHYPARAEGAEPPADTTDRFTVHQGRRVEQTARAHVDSGLLTVLAQCGVDGLQAQAQDGRWVEVPAGDDNCFAINFGGLMERWTGGRIKATLHRVLARGKTRYSVPFFFEPRPDTRIEPLPLAGVRPFTPFLYGDHLWATTTRFPENLGLAHLRPPRAPYTDPLADRPAQPPEENSRHAG